MHIGEILERHIRLSSVTKTELAKKLGLSRQHFRKVLQQPYIRTDRLVLLSKALNHNFFSYFQSQVPGGEKTSPEELRETIRSQHEKIVQQEEKIADLKEINRLLREKIRRLDV